MNIYRLNPYVAPMPFTPAAFKINDIIMIQQVI